MKKTHYAHNDWMRTACGYAIDGGWRQILGGKPRSKLRTSDFEGFVDCLRCAKKMRDWTYEKEFRELPKQPIGVMESLCYPGVIYFEEEDCN